MKRLIAFLITLILITCGVASASFSPKTLFIENKADTSITIAQPLDLLEINNCSGLSVRLCEFVKVIHIYESRNIRIEAEKGYRFVRERGSEGIEIVTGEGKGEEVLIWRDSSLETSLSAEGEGILIREVIIGEGEGVMTRTLAGNIEVKESSVKIEPLP